MESILTIIFILLALVMFCLILKYASFYDRIERQYLKDPINKIDRDTYVYAVRLKNKAVCHEIYGYTIGCIYTTGGDTSFDERHRFDDEFSLDDPNGDVRVYKDVWFAMKKSGPYQNNIEAYNAQEAEGIKKGLLWDYWTRKKCGKKSR